VKFAGGREVVGTLKGYDQLVNLVLDDCKETMRDPSNLYNLSVETREIGLIVARGSSIICLGEENGALDIPNPYLQEQE